MFWSNAGRGAPIVTAVLFVALAASAGDSKPTKQECTSAYIDAQRLRKADKLRDAKKKLELCADPACPATLQQDCKPWLAEVSSEVPSAAPSARDLKGEATTAVTLYVDGEKVADQLPADPIDLEPGEHTFRFELEGAQPIEVKLTLARGDRGKTVSADFSTQAPAPVEKPGPAPEPSDQPEPGRKISPAVYVLGGVGVLGLAGFAYFGITGKNDENDLANSCAPRCNPKDVDAAHRKFLFADISLGIGVAALGAATVLYFSSSKAPERTGLAVAPLPGGGGAFVNGRF